jgi:hypothetical protein
MMHSSMFISSVVVLVLLVSRCTEAIHAKSRRRKNGHPDSRSVRILNQSGSKIDIYWIHPVTRDLAHSNTDGQGIAYGSETGIASYVGHEFEVHELPSPKTGKCKHTRCRRTSFTVNKNEDQCKRKIRTESSFLIKCLTVILRCSGCS